ncbi:MAG TPA: sugar kinase [Pyrinomonadaceae bacterium]|nr:sugar kinase [Pyrinomonadaceae bacterium]
MADNLTIKPESACKWDIVSLGEVMLRFDPGDDRIHAARNFRVWEGGGEYNVARNIAKCFRLRAAIATALADNQIGRLVEDLILQGGVDASQILWRPTDGISREVRNGIYFMERGFGSRPPTGCSDRGNTAVSKLKPGDVDWKSLFSEKGTRWFHTGGIFAGLSETTAEIAAEAMSAAQESGSIVSYDLNYRESLWAGRGGRDAANELNRRLLSSADVVFGVEKFDAGAAGYSEDNFRNAATEIISRHPNIQILATTLRDVHSASRHTVGGACLAGDVYTSTFHTNVDVLDRVGSGDAFAAGFIYGMLAGGSMQTAIDLAAASSVLSLASLGDGSSSTLAEIERLATGAVRATDR